MSEKKEHQQQAGPPCNDVLCSPPSHPTTLGDVWLGETRAPRGALAHVLQFGRSEKTRDE